MLIHGQPRVETGSVSSDEFETTQFDVRQHMQRIDAMTKVDSEQLLVKGAQTWRSEGTACTRHRHLGKVCKTPGRSA